MGTFSTNQTTQSKEEMTTTDGILPEIVQKGHTPLAIPPGSGNATKVGSSDKFSDGYTLVTEGVKQVQAAQSETTKYVTNGKNTNLFEILNTDDNDDEPTEQQ